MPRKPKAKDGLTAGERVALYEAEKAQKRAQRVNDGDEAANNAEKAVNVEDATTLAVVPPKKEPKILPKPQHATVKVDFSFVDGKIKPMHAMCNGPKSYGADISGLFREIGVPGVRFAGTDTAMSAYAVDISRIFKNPDADPQDARNYDFALSDRYVRAAHDCGAKVIFRLGESYDRYGAKTVTLPVDADRFSEVCVNVIRHYNDYWAGGFAYGIERFEILECPEGIGEDERARLFELYRKVSTVVKMYDGSLRVGGMCFNDEGAAREFIKFCRRKHAPLDFLTVSCFDSDPAEASDRVKRLVPALKNLGYGETEIIIGSWAYIAKDVDTSTNIAKAIMFGLGGSNEKRAKLFLAQSGIKGAAYALSFMLEMGAMEDVTAAHLFDAQPSVSPWCPIADRFGAPQKAFYAFKMFGELYRAGRAVYCQSEQTEGYAHTGIYAGAALAENGAAYVLISSFEGCGVVDLRLDSIPSELYTSEIFILDGVKNFEAGDSVQLTGSKKRLLLNLSEYGAVLVKIY